MARVRSSASVSTFFFSFFFEFNHTPSGKKTVTEIQVGDVG